MIVIPGRCVRCYAELEDDEDIFCEFCRSQVIDNELFEDEV